MDIINPDLSHNNFLELANADIKSANALLQIKEYHNAVYHISLSAICRKELQIFRFNNESIYI